MVPLANRNFSSPALWVAYRAHRGATLSRFSIAIDARARSAAGHRLSRHRPPSPATGARPPPPALVSRAAHPSPLLSSASSPPLPRRPRPPLPSSSPPPAPLLFPAACARRLPAGTTPPPLACSLHVLPACSACPTPRLHHPHHPCLATPSCHPQPARRKSCKKKVNFSVVCVVSVWCVCVVCVCVVCVWCGDGGGVVWRW